MTLRIPLIELKRKYEVFYQKEHPKIQLQQKKMALNQGNPYKIVAKLLKNILKYNYSKKNGIEPRKPL